MIRQRVQHCEFVKHNAHGHNELREMIIAVSLIDTPQDSYNDSRDVETDPLFGMVFY